ncbi:hypothetical protein BV900_23990 [Agrobacterium tumefaciens]|nr:hypothetical protein BV900_23990 [Agrobacterium tumefaciens]
MTREQMRTTMNDLIGSGEMSLDESSALVPMAGPSQLNSVSGAQDAQYDAASIDFLALLQCAISGAQSRNDQQGAQGYMDSLAALQRYQDAGSDNSCFPPA